jgi:hypothetical protein
MVICLPLQLELLSERAGISACLIYMFKKEVLIEGSVFHKIVEMFNYFFYKKKKKKKLIVTVLLFFFAAGPEILSNFAKDDTVKQTFKKACQTVGACSTGMNEQTQIRLMLLWG